MSDMTTDKSACLPAYLCVGQWVSGSVGQSVGQCECVCVCVCVLGSKDYIIILPSSRSKTASENIIALLVL